MAQLRVDKLIHGFRLKKSFQVPEFRLLVAELFHDKTNAKYWHLQRDDSNKTFSVQFRTTPKNDSGVTHILEHTVLCGSKKYPVRDPFFKMLHRSQANFMNAITANDWTMYPFSTMNDVDFQNLFEVYTDAVFNPNLTELDFMQEGWRLQPKELSDPSSSLEIKGVVFNEMKGVFSNALHRFGQTVQNKLLPHTYGFVSGGHPDCIPTLTWDALKEFHQFCYHPSNACFYTYGDANLEWCLQRLNDDYLGKFETLQMDNEVPLEPVWDAPRYVELACEPDPLAPDPERQSVASLSYRLDDIRNVYNTFILGILSKLLIDGDNAPLYRGLIESGFGLDWASGLCGMDQGARTTSFHVGVQGVRVQDLSEFSNLVGDIFKKVQQDGFPKERIESTLHQYELAVRHESARFGLNLVFSLSHYVNHGADISELLHVQNLITRFRSDLEARPSMLSDLIQTYLIDNKHTLLATMKPDESWQTEQAKRDLMIQESLVSGISSSQQKEWREKSHKLHAQQQAIEDVSCLPCLALLDIPMDCRREPFTMTEVNGCQLQLNEGPTNGIVYFHALANLGTLPPDLLVYVPLFCELFPRLGADDLDYLEMDHAIDLHTGGLNVSPHATPGLPSCEPLNTRCGIHLSGHCLVGKLPNFFELWSKLFRAPTWSDRQRLTTLVLMSSSGDWSANAIADSAHRFAMRRAAANLSNTCRLQELWSGLEQASFMKKIGSKLGKEQTVADPILNDLTDKMISIWQHIANTSRLRFSLHGESEGLSVGLQQLNQFVSSLPSSSDVTVNAQDSLTSLAKLSLNSYFVMPYTVHYTAQAFPAPSYDSPDFATFCVLSQLLAWKFLHREIREKGGAYGGRAIAKPESFLFFSYRDPQAHRTLETFRNSLTWALNTDFEAQDLNEAKLAVFQELDQPVSAGSRGLTNFLYGIDDELRQENRNHVFTVENSTIHSVADQLINFVPASGHVVLGPKNSPDWPSDVELGLSWDRVVMQD